MCQFPLRIPYFWKKCTCANSVFHAVFPAHANYHRWPGDEASYCHTHFQSCIPSSTIIIYIRYKDKVICKMTCCGKFTMEVTGSCNCNPASAQLLLDVQIMITIALLFEYTLKVYCHSYTSCLYMIDYLEPAKLLLEHSKIPW